MLKKTWTVTIWTLQEGPAANKDKFIPDPDMQGLIERFVSHMCNEYTQGVSWAREGGTRL